MIKNQSLLLAIRFACICKLGIINIFLIFNQNLTHTAVGLDP